MWTIARFEPNRVIDMHCTETLDYQTVLEGSVTLGLEVGAVELSRGDMVMIPGLLHAWTAGPEGCVISAITLRLTAV
jgi:quercetin dioxygenase-like cupin family protein